MRDERRRCPTLARKGVPEEALGERRCPAVALDVVSRGIMDSLRQGHETLCRDSNLSRSIDDVQKTIDLLVRARESIATSEQPPCGEASCLRGH